ncbi:hypothetical protein OS493_026876 [Desmophyllum pertusum]|uniref:Uncharacterized protein n=1 Tax=Desmophyllum pertusum TaxID=174260 RepID=A0A9W9ZAG8_9CNID|nr:hypothetical protein OS493_026876 [Desmophyllum pertusum]
MEADVNWKGSKILWFRTPLMQAAKSGMTEVCRLYLEHGAKVDALTESRYTALILGARYGKTEACQLLLSKGANVNNQTKEGETALMWAAHGGHCNTCQLPLGVWSQDRPSGCLWLHSTDSCSQRWPYGHLHCSFGLWSRCECCFQAWKHGLDAECWARANKHQTLSSYYRVTRSVALFSSMVQTHLRTSLSTSVAAVNAGKTTLIGNLQLGSLQA